MTYALIALAVIITVVVPLVASGMSIAEEDLNNGHH